jgi:signal transduction histidine kinase
VGSDNLTFGLNRETQALSSAFPIFNGTPFVTPNSMGLKIAQRQLLNELILTNLFVLVAAGFISYVLARETMKPIEEAHEQQKHFTADVSHELRTPLTALKMESEVALMDNSLNTKELKQVISSNIEEAEKLDSLINSLLRLTRLEANELQHQFNQINLVKIVEEAKDHVQTIANNKNIIIKIAGGPLTIQGDHDSLVQLIVILLDNAIKYSSKDSTIKLTTSKNNTKPSITIEDHGKGIASKDLEHVFDRFYRADDARSGSTGFGLGLSIAKLIADLHQANITITSQVNNGTKVKIDFKY